MLHGYCPPERYLPYLSWTQIAALPDKANTVIVLPAGSTEQHGPHLPCAVDTIIAAGVIGHALARLPAEIPAYALAPICYGKSDEHLHFPGTVTVEGTTLLETVTQIGESVYRMGFRKLLIVNAHGATLVALFPIIANTTLGLRSVNAGLMSFFKLHRATRLQTLVRLRIPSALPYFFGGLRISSGLALIGAVVAEFVAGTGGTGTGLAYQILQAGYQLNIPRMFAALVLITLTGVLLFALMSVLSSWALSSWHESETHHD